jgi:hypothetical protein
MRLDINFPIQFTGKPPRGKRERDVFISYAYSADIPEIAGRETETVFEAAEAFLSRDDTTLVARPYRLLAHDGRLYREVAAAGEAATFGKRAFTARTWHVHRGYRESVSFAQEEQSASPVASPIQKHYNFRLMIRSGKEDRLSDTWPPRIAAPGEADLHPANDIFLFSGKAPDAHLVDMAVIDEAVEMYSHQCSRLLAVDGAIWIETPPPCYTVETAFPRHFDNYANARHVRVHLSHVEAGPANRLDTVQFPLSQRQEAFAFAQDLAGTVLDAEVVSQSVGFDAERTALLEFDQGRTEVARLGTMLVGSIQRFLNDETHKTIRKSMTPELFAIHQLALDEVVGNNPALGQVPDLAPHMEGIVHVWKKLNKTDSGFRVLGDRTKTSNLITARGLEHARNAAISLDIGYLP